MKLTELLKESKSGTFYYSPGKDKLPEDMVQLFTKLAHQQRAIPEDTMYQITNKYQLRWLGYLLEHLGDLIHGFADAVNYNGVAVRDIERKLQSAQKTLTHLDANLADLAKTNKLEAKKRNMTEEEYVHEVETALESYAAAHYKLPAYNEIHLICKHVTTTLGAMQFEECKKYIDQLLHYANEGTLFKRSLTITRDKQGNIVQIG